MKKIIFILAFTLLFAACNNKKETNESSQEKVVDEHNAENSLDWNGTYKGITPCASCEGIFTTIKLNSDMTYEKSYLYLGEKGDTYNENGKFSFLEDKTTIKLNSKDEASLYRVEEGSLVMLNSEGKEVTDKLAEYYRLQKMSDAEVEFTDKPIKGYLTIDAGIATFNPCGYSKIYSLKYSGKTLNKKYNAIAKKSANKQPVMAELKVKYLGEAKNYDGLLELKEIVNLEYLTVDSNCL
ncbi:MAG: hypothetical protein CR986_02960 [Ignavibacteriae bacterium]|nr:MAG: hypothetical protein CR986_02960 [Ignavibacteriota bacterium]